MLQSSETQLTIGMPVFNEEKYISSAIKSLQTQTYQNFRLIISDNCSTDNTSSICRQFAKQDPRITYIRHEINKGSFLNAKFLVQKATTKYFMYACGHDTWHPEFIRELLPVIQSDTSIVLVYPICREIKRDGDVAKLYKENYNTFDSDDICQRYLNVISKNISGNPVLGIWSTKILKHCFRIIKPGVANDRLLLNLSALMGKSKQINKTLFFLRTMRKERDMFVRQLVWATGKPNLTHWHVHLAEFSFIYDHIRFIARYGKLSYQQRVYLIYKTTIILFWKLFIWEIDRYVGRLGICLRKKSPFIYELLQHLKLECQKFT